MKEIALYTSIFGVYDKFRPVSSEFKKEADLFIFTNMLDIRSNDYEVIRVEQTHPNLRRESRRYKICPHRYLPKYKYWIYIDGSIEMYISPRKLINEYLNGYDIAVLKHPWRNCIYTEAKECRALGLVGNPNLKRQLIYYRMAGYPENNGLTENGVMIRRNTAKIREFNDFWKLTYDNFTHRDQLSFCFCAWKMNLKYNMIDTKIRAKDADMFKLNDHL